MGSIGTPASGGQTKYQMIVHTDEEATVTASLMNGGTTKSFGVENGVAMISGLTNGTWIIRANLDGHYRTYNKIITSESECEIVYLHYNRVPSFAYQNGTSLILTDADATIATGIGTVGNWKLKFTTSGKLMFNDLKGQYIDIFLVGGGGAGKSTSSSGWGASGGGGGYTKTIKNFRAEEGVWYTVSVGGQNGGSSKFSGGTINPISLTASGGLSGNDDDQLYGGDGGCGGGGGAARGKWTTELKIAGSSGDGGSDGNNGTDGADGVWYYKDGTDLIDVISTSHGGNGQGYSTTEFELGISMPYSPGGAGGALQSENIGSRGYGKQGANSGAGGSATNSYGWTMTGQSGVVIIRNSRGQYGFPEE